MATLAFFIFLCLLECLSDSNFDGCESPQYLVYGREGVIHCPLQGAFSSVFWYDSINIVEHEPIVTLEDSIKGGKGYKSGDFNITSDGSLIIPHVDFRHRKTFIAAMFTSFKEAPRLFNVTVVVTGVMLDRCDSPQYLEYGKTGTIQCQFARDFSHVFWYNSTDTVSDAPIVTYSQSGKGGNGFISGEFDIIPNGSLIITEVRLVHEHNYTVAIFASLNDDPTYFGILLIVFVKPIPAYPVVEGCISQHECQLKVYRSGNLTCSILGIRPQVALECKVAKDSYQKESFFDSTYTVSPSDGEKLNITFILYFNFTTETSATVECGVFGRGSDIFSELKSSVDLQFVDGIQEEEPSVTPSIPSNKQWNYLVFGILVFLVIFGSSAGGVFHLRSVRSRRKIKRRRSSVKETSININNSPIPFCRITTVDYIRDPLPQTDANADHAVRREEHLGETESRSETLFE